MIETLFKQLGERSASDPQLAARVIALLYRELRALAGRIIRREPKYHTLQATALVHELYLLLRKARELPVRDRREFLGLAAHLMRRLLVQHARRKASIKRGGGIRRTTLTATQVGSTPHVDLVALDLALEELGQHDARKARVVTLRYFAGLTVEETASALDLSPATVDREWRRARAWLFDRLGGAGDRGL